MADVVVERSGRFAAGPARLWPLISDTGRLNREAGLGQVRFAPLDGDTAARFEASAVLGGFPVTYEELPFEWTENREMRVVRRMRGGPVRELDTRVSLEPDGAGTQVAVRLRMEVRTALLAPLIRWNAGRAATALIDAVRRLDAGRGASGGAALREDAWRRAAAALREADASPVAERIARHVAEAPDVDASRIRPFALADAWGEDRRATLAACLGAVRAGLLELRWEVVCPSCRNAPARVPTLAALDEHAACHYCEVAFGVDFDEAVEATFSPAPAVRTLELGPWCSGGPARTPHVLAQAVVAPGAEATLAAPAAGERLRVFWRGGDVVRVVVREGAPPEVTAEGEQVEVAPGGRVRARNVSARERHVKLERVDAARDAATAREVTALAAFRDHFSADTLRPGLSLRVSRVTLLFSDLTGSTALYARAGDAPAFKLVQDHFDVLRAELAAHGGVLVKTMGDAVMAAFADEDDALRAGVAMLTAFEGFRAGGGLRAQVGLKLGLFTGPCYVCNANGVLDYFGQSVNVAARLQGRAAAGELVVVEAAAARASALGLPVTVAPFAAALKGVEGTVAAARVTPTA